MKKCKLLFFLLFFTFFSSQENPSLTLWHQTIPAPPIHALWHTMTGIRPSTHATWDAMTSIRSCMAVQNRHMGHKNAMSVTAGEPMNIKEKKHSEAETIWSWMYSEAETIWSWMKHRPSEAECILKLRPSEAETIWSWILRRSSTAWVLWGLEECYGVI